MEGIAEQRQETMVEVDWRNLEKNAPAQAELLIKNIKGYEGMTAPEKVSALVHLLNELDPEDNANRYVAERIAAKAKGLGLTVEYKKNMAELGETV